MEKSVKRKFRGERLYKLSKLIVIIVSSLSLGLGILNYVGIKRNGLLNFYSEYCSSYEVGDTEGYLNCWKLAWDSIDTQYNDMYRGFAIGILLPIIFFGGAGIYRYLFPISPKDD